MSGFVPVRAAITKADYIRATDVATDRVLWIIENGSNSPRNQGPADGSSKSYFNNLIGTTTELVAKRFLDPHNLNDPLKWNDSPDKPSKGVPDLYNNWLLIDVKGRSKHSYDLLVQLDDCWEEWVYLLVTGTHPRYYIRGWCWGWEVMGCPIKNFGGPAYCVDQDAKCMKHPNRLRRLLHERTFIEGYRGPRGWLSGDPRGPAMEIPGLERR